MRPRGERGGEVASASTSIVLALVGGALVADPSDQSHRSFYEICDPFARGWPGRGSAASCNVATSRSVTNLFMLQHNDRAAGLTSEFFSSKRIYWWSLPVSSSDTRPPLISPATRSETKVTSGIEFSKPGRFYVNTDP